MKKIMRLLAIFPFVTLADVPSPTFIYRLRRVGYEILPQPGCVSCPGFGAVGVVMCALIVGLAILLICKFGGRMPKPRWAAPIATAYRKHPIAFGMCMCLLVATPVLYGVGLSVTRTVVSVIAMMDGYGVVYDERSGWKYPTELSESERAEFKLKLDGIPARLCEKVEAEWKKNSCDGSEEHAEGVIVAVLKEEPELCMACFGVPVEMLVERYFITERWYCLGRHSFTHPRSVQWDAKLNMFGSRVKGNFVQFMDTN